MTKSNIVVADRFTAVVAETKPYGVIVRLGDTGATALLHVSRIAGGTHGAQARRLANDLTVGATTEVEVVSVERDGKRQKVSVSEKSLQDARVLAELEVGSTVRGTVAGKREFGAFVRIADGAAAGVDGLVHISELPGGNPAACAKALDGLREGDVVTAEVLSVSQESGALRVSLSLRGEERRVAGTRYGAGTVHTGRVVKRAEEGFLVSFGAVTGFLPFAELGKAGAGSVRVGGNVRARIVEVDARLRATLTRKGL